MANNNKDIDNLIKGLTEALTKSNTNSNNTNIDGASNVALEINKKINEKSTNQRNYAARIASEMSRNINTETIVIPRVYAEYQPSFVVSINGCTIKIPADGKPRLVHSDYAVILRRRMRKLDEKIAHMRSNPNGDIREIK